MRRSLSVLVFLGACSPSISLPVLEPALIAVPAGIRTVAVVDRSGSSSGGQAFLGALESIVTGERIQGDRQGRAQAIRTLAEGLEASPRFKVLVPSVDNELLEPSLWDTPWRFSKIKRLCRSRGCDAVIALEAYDSDARVTTGLLSQRFGTTYNDDPSLNYWAESELSVVTSWRFYDAKKNRVLDSYRDRTYRVSTMEKSDTAANARSALRPFGQADSLARRAATEYSRRVAPTWITVSRDYYAKGSPDLKEAKKYVSVSDWPGAVVIWREIAKNSDEPELKGKALFNLALAAEVDGELEKAISLAKKASIKLDSSRSRSYVHILQNRINQLRELEAQLAPPSPRQPRGTPKKRSNPSPNQPTDGGGGSRSTPDQHQHTGSTDGGGGSRSTPPRPKKTGGSTDGGGGTRH